MIEQDAIFWYNKMKKEKRMQASWYIIISSNLRHISKIYFGFLFYESIHTSWIARKEKRFFF